MSSGRIAPCRRFRVLLALGGLSLISGLTGCGSKDPYAYVEAKGKVTYADGTPIGAAHVRLTFIAENAADVDEHTHPRPGYTDVTNPDGTFDYVTTHIYADGLLPGKHKVIVQALDDKEIPIPGKIPPEYGDRAKTPIEVDTATQPMVISVNKPLPGAKKEGAPQSVPPRKP